MNKQELTAGSFTIKLGHPVLIFLWSAWMLLLGCAIGMHWHRSHTVAVCVSIACAVLIVVHEMISWICLVHNDSLVAWEVPT